MSKTNSQTILKIADACNLNCSYCYYYADSFSPEIPPNKLMPKHVVETYFQKVVDHCRIHGLQKYGILLHGGEPLLAGKKYYRWLFELARRYFGNEIEIEWSLQTNGVLLDDEYVGLFRENGVSISVSLDGPKEIHNRFRLDKRGRGTFAETIDALELLERNGYPPAILCTIFPDDDGHKVYTYFRSLDIKWMNFMLPDYSYDTFPYDDLSAHNKNCLAYMKGAFDAWFEEDNPAVSVQYFKDLVRSSIGERTEMCTMQESCPNFITLETNGTVNHCDVMRLSGTSNYETGVSIQEPLDAIDEHPIHRKMGEPQGLLCSTCRACEFLSSCGGHCPGTRYSEENGFDNVSIYCEFFKAFIPYVEGRVAQSLN